MKKLAVSILPFFFYSNFALAERTINQATSPLINIVDEMGFMEFSEELSGAAEDQKRLVRNMKGTDFIPTGLYFPPNSTIKINVKKLQGDNFPQLLIGTYARNKNRPIPRAVLLHKGENQISDNIGGLIYIRYVTEAHPNSKVSINFISGYKKVPVFILGKTSNAEWVKMLDKYNESPDIQLISQKVFLVASRTNSLKNKNADQEDMLRNIDIAVAAEEELSGLDNSSHLDVPAIHKHLITESENLPPEFYANTADYRIAVLPSAMDTALQNNNSYVWNWGIWHELGHTHQQAQWSWSEILESSVNIYTLAANRALGSKDKRFNDGKLWNKTRQYLEGKKDKDFNSSKLDAWMRLVMFEQLRAAFGDKFYQELSKISRFELSPNPAPKDRTEKIEWFMLRSCVISQKDLTEFFKKWGLEVKNDSIYQKIAALSLSKLDYDLSSIDVITIGR